MTKIQTILNRNIPAFRPASWEAKFQGRTLGYFTTAEEAQACVDAARAEAEADRDAE